jgi:3-oxoacyl-[acyl-carrier-protein] synthase III
MPREHLEFLDKNFIQPTMGNYMFADQALFEWQERAGKGFAVEGIKQAVEKASLRLSDIDMIFFHQTLEALDQRWMQGGEEHGLPSHKWIRTWTKYGTVGNSDVGASLAIF